MKGYLFGNYTSQWFANFYLQSLDHYIKEELKIKYYLRYMDDMILFGKNGESNGKRKRGAAAVPPGGQCGPAAWRAGVWPAGHRLPGCGTGGDGTV